MDTVPKVFLNRKLMLWTLTCIASVIDIPIDLCNDKWPLKVNEEMLQYTDINYKHQSSDKVRS